MKTAFAVDVKTFHVIQKFFFFVPHNFFRDDLERALLHVRYRVCDPKWKDDKCHVRIPAELAEDATWAATHLLEANKGWIPEETRTVIAETLGLKLT